MLRKSKPDSFDCNSKIWTFTHVGVICHLCVSWDREEGEGQAGSITMDFWKWELKRSHMGMNMPQGPLSKKGMFAALRVHEGQWWVHGSYSLAGTVVFFPLSFVALSSPLNFCTLGQGRSYLERDTKKSFQERLKPKFDFLAPLLWNRHLNGFCSLEQGGTAGLHRHSYFSPRRELLKVIINTWK